MNWIIGLLFLFIGSINIAGQINVKIGYGLGKVSAKQNNSLFHEYNEIKRNELTDSLSIPFKNLGAMHGIDLGVRYRLSRNSALELNWQALSGDRKAIGEINNSTLFSKELFYSFKQYYVSYQRSISNYGFGIGLGRNSVSIKDRIAGSSFKGIVVKQSQLFTKINLAIYFESSKSISFSIQPFIQLPLEDIDLNPLRSELELPEGENVREPFQMIGVSFVFYNGKQ